MVTATRTALIETATGIVRRQGYAGFSADLAEAVGMPQGVYSPLLPEQGRARRGDRRDR